MYVVVQLLAILRRALEIAEVLDELERAYRHLRALAAEIRRLVDGLSRRPEPAVT
jgi:hypothetical protein